MVPDEQPAATEADYDELVRGWLGHRRATRRCGGIEFRVPARARARGGAVARASFPNVAHVLPLVLRQREHLDFARLQREAARRNENQALGR
jgi:hypothetical protein